MTNGPTLTTEGVKRLRVGLRRITRQDSFHFFGYYDKCPWNASGRYVLAKQISFCDRQPRPGEGLAIGMIDLQDNDRFIELDQTAAWSWQQGTMLQWLASAPERLIIYNTVDGDHYAGVIRDVHSGETQTLPRSIYAVSRDGTQAVGLNFDRVNRLRPGYGYCALPEEYPDDPAPQQAGIYHIDLERSESRLIVSLADLAAHAPDERFADQGDHWVNHLEFNPSGTRFLFLHRWWRSGRSHSTRLYTARPDGADRRLVLDSDHISHFCWRDDDTLLVWAKHDRHRDEKNYLLVDAMSGRQQVVGDGVLTVDGHCTFSPDGRWILTDTYPNAQSYRTLILYRVADGQRFDLGDFYSQPHLDGPFRCDLHPRFNRDGSAVCIDSSHEGGRQVYVLDVRPIVT